MMRWLKNLPNSTAFWLALIGIVLVCSILALVFGGWDWLRALPSEGQTGVTMESRSTTIRNAGFVIAGAIALVFAVWRGLVAERQAAASQRQAETAEQTLLNERYQRGAEMLVSRVLAVRMEGIRSLEQLAEDQPDLYYVRVRQLISDFARDPTGIEEDQDGASLDEELRSV